MTLTAMVEKLDERRYRAAIVQPFAMESEGATEKEAIDRLRSLALEKLRSSKIVEIQMPEDERENPWLKIAGLFKDHPDWDQYLKNIEDYRREVDRSEQP